MTSRAQVNRLSGWRTSAYTPSMADISVPRNIREALGGTATGWETPRPAAAISEAEDLADVLTDRGWCFDGAASGREYVSWQYHPNDRAASPQAAGSTAAIRATVAFGTVAGHTGSYIEAVTVNLLVISHGQLTQEGYVMPAEDFRAQLTAIEAHKPQDPANIDCTAKHRVLPDRPVRF